MVNELHLHIRQTSIDGYHPNIYTLVPFKRRSRIARRLMEFSIGRYMLISDDLGNNLLMFGTTESPPAMPFDTSSMDDLDRSRILLSKFPISTRREVVRILRCLDYGPSSQVSWILIFRCFTRTMTPMANNTSRTTENTVSGMRISMGLLAGGFSQPASVVGSASLRYRER